jgi:Helix-turn-helix domain of resolvase
MTNDNNDQRIDKLEDEIKQRDRRIAELKHELDEARDLQQRLTDQVQDSNNQIDNWIQAFEMEPNEAGVWQWKRSFVEGDDWYKEYQTIMRQWNKFVPEYNAAILRRNVGRPLAASDAQAAHVRKLHKAGKSLRWIAEETNLGVNTVRTIVGKADGTDRTTIKHLQRIDPDRARPKQWTAKRQQRDALPKRINELRKAGDDLIKEAKRGAR